jgi:hypothetical protein
MSEKYPNIESLVEQFGDDVDKIEWEGIKKLLNETTQKQDGHLIVWRKFNHDPR